MSKRHQQPQPNQDFEVYYAYGAQPDRPFSTRQLGVANVKSPNADLVHDHLPAIAEDLADQHGSQVDVMEVLHVDYDYDDDAEIIEADLGLPSRASWWGGKLTTGRH